MKLSQNNLSFLFNRNKSIFSDDVKLHEEQIFSKISKSNFLIIGGGGSIGKEVTKQIFKRNPKILDVVDISENNLVELVRDIRSDLGYIDGKFNTYAIDYGDLEFQSMLKNFNSYDYVMNLSALKHVRSEQDPYTIMRMIMVNIVHNINLLKLIDLKKLKKFFCVSTDKASNPHNLMGASKRIMELFLINHKDKINVSMSRFANVAFSDGSLLHGFLERFKKNQPLSAPNDVKRYFMSHQEAGELCLMSTLFGKNTEIFFPKNHSKLTPISFDVLATKMIKNHGYKPYLCKSEEEARKKINQLTKKKYWPCYFFKSDTTGEKIIEEFYQPNDILLSRNRFKNIGIIKNNYDNSNFEDLNLFLKKINSLRKKKYWQKKDLVKIFKNILDDFDYVDKNKYLNDKM